MVCVASLETQVGGKPAAEAGHGSDGHDALVGSIEAVGSSAGVGPK